ncbi:hypothetical protein [Jiulongibacter sp. NS-SX5]|uniref:hypothetical protein n=1 Tax=Jiulongibacter sp. NS-SX5 TaxID=3463854 RepID=UPI004058CBD5
MKPLKLLLAIAFAFIISCSKEDIENETPAGSGKLQFTNLVLTIDGTDFSSDAAGDFARRLTSKIPYESKNSTATIKTFEVSGASSSDFSTGDSFQIDVESEAYENGLKFNVTDAKSGVVRTFSIYYEVEFPEFQVTPVPVTPLVTKAPKTVMVTFENRMNTDEYYDPNFDTNDRGPWHYWAGINNANSIVTGADGYKETQWHHTPLIDVYDGGDPAYLEYAALMMKLSGINVVQLMAPIVSSDYGYEPTHFLGDTFLAKEMFKKVGLKYFISQRENGLDFGFDPFPEEVQKERNEALYNVYETNFFSDENYFKEDGLPYLFYEGLHENVYKEIYFESFKDKAKFMINGQIIFPDNTPEIVFDNGSAITYDPSGYFNDELDFSLSESLKRDNCKPNLKCSSIIRPSKMHYLKNLGDDGFVPFNEGEWFQKSLDLSNQLNSDFYFIDTWNDYRSGNSIEPTVANGYKALEMVQQFTGSPYSVSELELVHEMYVKRKAFAKDTYAQGKLDQVFEYLNGSKFNEAESLLATIE